MRTQAAEVIGELGRQHRSHATRDVDGDTALGGVRVEGRAGGDVGGDVGDVHPGLHAAALVDLERERVVEVLRLLRVDGEREEVTQVDSVRLCGWRERRQRRVRPAHALVPEQAFEDGLDPARRAQYPFESGPAPPEPDDDEIADRRLARSLAIDDHGNAALEVRLADKELALPGQLADEQIHSYWRLDLKLRRAG